MRELTAIEIEEVNGGFVWLLACYAGVGLILGGSYIAGYISGSGGRASTNMQVGVLNFGIGGSISACTPTTHP